MGGEPNQVKWWGVRPIAGIRGVWPAVDSLRINKEVEQAGEGSAIIYTVPVGKVFFLSAAGIAAFNSAGGGNTAGVGIRNADDTHQFYLCFHYFAAQSEVSDAHRLFPAIEVPAGYDVYVVSSSANVTVLGSAFGWLEDA